MRFTFAQARASSKPFLERVILGYTKRPQHGFQRFKVVFCKRTKHEISYKQKKTTQKRVVGTQLTRKQKL